MKSTRNLLGRVMRFKWTTLDAIIDGFRSILPNVPVTEIVKNGKRERTIRVRWNDAKYVDLRFNANDTLLAIHCWRVEGERRFPSAIREMEYDFIDAILGECDKDYGPKHKKDYLTMHGYTGGSESPGGSYYTFHKSCTVNYDGREEQPDISADDDQACGRCTIAQWLSSMLCDGQYGDDLANPIWLDADLSIFDEDFRLTLISSPTLIGPSPDDKEEYGPDDCKPFATKFINEMLSMLQ